MSNNTERNAPAANGITELVFILDRSGSMFELEGDTIGGFNSMIEKQKKEASETYVTTVLFNDTNSIVHDRIKLQEVPKMTDKDYIASGSTALLDAVGSTIKHIKNIHKYLRPEDVPERTLFVITTDGMENASHKYDYDKIKKMIEKRQEKNGWEFMFLGANIDSVAEAAKVGIRADRAANYKADAVGTANLYSSISNAVTAFRSGRRDNYEE